MRYTKSSVCQLGWLSCFGCCGHSFKEKPAVADAITKNTIEFHNHLARSKPLPQWMNRHTDLRDAGICRNLIYDHKTDEIFCPLHPERNKGKDYRIDHHSCDILHICKTAFFFDLWEEKMKNEFIDFIKKKKQAGELDWYTYSLKMADDSLLHEFEGLKWD